MPRTYEFTDLNGRHCIATKKGIDSLIPIIEERIERAMPKETVELSKVKEIIKNFKVNYHRDLTKEEAAAILAVIKTRMIKEIDELHKYFVSREANNQE